MNALGVVVATVGALLVLLAAVGVLRLPDLFSRLHAATKASSLGTATVLLGTSLVVPELGVWVRAGLAVAFQMLTAPVAAHVIARAAYRTGVPHGAVVDELGSWSPRERSTRDAAGPGT
ncbi:MAG TPA: monovalent cation/H(+) antiporter subunit G [Nitriliruptorales bacterium]|nr:monovalent cation/H(+) antiporter subunit G [Nitriliruptorales bacterium]